MSSRCVVLVGLPGSGKTTVGKLLHDRYGWSWADVDAELELAAGRTIAEIIRVEGEQQFRALETKHLYLCLEQAALGQKTQVVSVGGGALLREENRNAVTKHARPIRLAVQSAEAAERVMTEELSFSAGGLRRPVLFGDKRPTLEDAQRRLDELAAEREPLYSLAKTKVWTDFAAAEQVADVVQAECQVPGDHPATIVPDAVSKPGAISTVVIGADALRTLGERMRLACPNAERAAVVVDSNVFSAWKTELKSALDGSRMQLSIYEVASGESSKALTQVEQLAEKMVASGFTREDMIVGVGGGVVGDLSGLLASIFMRGIEHVQVPTTVVGQVDSAIGGKNAVNLSGGKNLIGTFHPAVIVLSDPRFFETLPEREFRSGLAEVVKYGAVFSAEFFNWLETDVDRILKRDSAALSRIVEESTLFKTGVVTRDLYDKLGLRALLNFGHTVGHALEKLCGYGELLHGEAVAIGMVEAMRLGLKLGVTPEGDMSRVASLLREMDLPTEIPESVRADGQESRRDKWLGAVRADKKRSGNTLSFILLERIGAARVVPVEVETAMGSITRSEEYSEKEF